MWNSSPMAPHQAPTPQGQFRSGDLNYQQQAQSQAQTQAQINALQQQNALLNQQLANQSFTHIQHLQQLIPHQQSMPQQAPSPSLPPQPPVQPEPQLPTTTPPIHPPASSPTSPSLNTEEMLNKMRQNLKADLDAAIQKPKEQSLQQTTNSPPLSPLPLTTQPTVAQASKPWTTAHSSRRSRSPPHHRESRRDDKRPISIPRSPPRRRARSHASSQRRRRASPSYREQESSVTLRSVSLPKPEISQLRLPPGWSHSRSPQCLCGFNTTLLLPTWTAKPTCLAPTGLETSHDDQSGRSNQAAWQEWDTWGKWGEPAYSHQSFLAWSANGSTQTCGSTLSRTTIITLKTSHGIFVLTSRPFRQTSKTCQILLATTFTSHTSILGNNSNPERPYQGLAQGRHPDGLDHQGEVCPTPQTTYDSCLWTYRCRKASITTILPSMVRTHECSCPAPTQHAQTSDSAIVASHSVGNLHDGTYVDTTCPTEQLGIITTFSTNSTQCSSTTHSAIPTTSPLSTDTTVATDPTLLTHDNDLSVATTLDQPFTFWSTTQDRQERSHQSLWLWSQSTLARRSGSLRQSEDQRAHSSQIYSSVSLHAKAWHWRMWSSVIAGGCA